MKFFREIFFGEEKTFTLRVIFFHALILAASVIFLYLFSYSTSPRYETFGDDSAIFQAVGKGWTEGLLPYVDMFENKGPLIFLIDAVGYMIYPRVGIFLLQIPAMYLAMLFAWRALGIFLSGKAKFAAAIFMLIYYAFYSLDGNRTEEWSMPLLMAATYLFLRGLKEKNFSCPPYVGFFYGLGFGACVMLRAINALPICCYALLAAIFLLKSGEVKILLKNFLNFCAGFAIICLPFVIYFAAHGALYDMLYGTILLNVNYTADSSSYPLNFVYIFYVMTKFDPLLALTILSLAVIVKDRSKLIFSGFFVGAIMLIFMIKLRPYIGYCALIVPAIPFLFIVVVRAVEIFRTPVKNILQTKNFSPKRIALKFFIVCNVLVGMSYVYLYAMEIYSLAERIDAEYARSECENNKLLQLKEIIPESERHSFVTWGRSGFIARWSLVTNMNSREKFFGYIKSFGDIDPSIRKNWFQSIKENPPLWILYCWKKNEMYLRNRDSIERVFLYNKDKELEKFLVEKYELRAMKEVSMQIVKLYRLKQ